MKFYTLEITCLACLCLSIMAVTDVNIQDDVEAKLYEIQIEYQRLYYECCDPNNLSREGRCPQKVCEIITKRIIQFSVDLPDESGEE